MTEDEMVGWHHQLDRHGFRWTLGVGDGQGGLVCCGSWGCKESDTTERQNRTEPVFLDFPGGSNGKKNLPAMQETCVPSLSWEDPLKDSNPLQYSCLKNPHVQRNLEGDSPWDHKESEMT